MAKGKYAQFPSAPEGSVIEYSEGRAVAWYPPREKVVTVKFGGTPPGVNEELWALLKPGAVFELLSDGWTQLVPSVINISVVVDDTVVVYRTWNIARRKWMYALESVAMLSTLWEEGGLKAVGYED